MGGVDGPVRAQVIGRAHGQVRGAALAGGELFEQVCARWRLAQDRGGGQVPQKGDAGEHAPALAEHEHRVEGVEAGAAVCLVDQ